MNSCIYISKLFHERKKPKENRFTYGIYMLYLDLDELPEIDRKIRIFGYNRWNILSFYDADHFKFLDLKGDADKIAQEKVSYDKKKYLGKDTKERIKTMIEELGLGFSLGKVFILTNLRNLGYIFNPVSFYFCYDDRGEFRAMFSEVNNTFHDQKMYYMVADPKKKRFRDAQRKNYYISPFIDYDTDLRWDFQVPGKTLSMKIDSFKGNEAVLRTVLTAKRKELDNLSALYLILRYPMMTFMIIVMIHYQALKLVLKKVPFHRKEKTDKRILGEK